MPKHERTVTLTVEVDDEDAIRTLDELKVRARSVRREISAMTLEFLALETTAHRVMGASAHGAGSRAAARETRAAAIRAARDDREYDIAPTHPLYGARREER